MLKDLQVAVGHEFKNVELLRVALTHRSYLNEHKSATEHNERLEFLGDAVLELIVTKYLFKTYPDRPEGELTTWRSALVKGERLAAVARDLQLGQYLQLSRGEAKSGGRDKGFLLANTFEAVLGALYLDAGFTAAEKFVARVLLPLLAGILAEGEHIDAKSRLQELAQERRGITPEYRLLSATGPDHEKIFTMGAFLREENVGLGSGGSKQAAEQSAARDALEKLAWK